MDFFFLTGQHPASPTPAYPLLYLACGGYPKNAMSIKEVGRYRCQRVKTRMQRKGKQTGSSLPVSWTWVCANMGESGGWGQKRPLEYVWTSWTS